MKKLFKFGKPYAPMIILAILLLFAQANFELALPDYLSKIVDTGIQKGGIENAVPIGLRETTMNKINIFMSEENKTMVRDAYELVNSSHSKYEKQMEKYPILKNESIYILKSISQDQIDELNLVIALPLLIIYQIEQIIANESMTMQIAMMLGINPSLITPNMDIYPILSALSEEQINMIYLQISEQYEILGEKMIITAAVTPIKKEYTALGLDTDKLQNDYILNVGGIMLLFTFFSVISTIAVTFLASKSSTGMARDIRRSLFEKVEHFSSTEFDKFSTASLITRSTNDITQIQMVFFMIIRMVFFAPLMGIGGIIRAMGKASSMWWLIAVAVAFLMIIITLLFAVSMPKFKLIQKLVDKLNLIARENLSGMMVIRSFNMQEFEEDRFDRANLDLTAVSLFVNRLMVIIMPLMMLIMNGLSVAIIWVGSHEVAASNLEIGDMIAFMQYAMHIVMSFLMISMMFIMLPRAAVSGDRIEEVLETEIRINDPENPKQLPQNLKGIVQFKDVNFRYHGGEEDALNEINLTALPGQTTGIIGATGSGKSTLVNLIPRLYDVSSGQIEIDGIDIRDITQHELRKVIGYVPQKSSLFSGTIGSNLFYADENATEETIENAIEIAQANDFVSSLSEGLEYPISQGGQNVSGGQKQRLSIARAIVKKPSIYILDDSFSALDFKTDVALRRAFKQKAADATLMIVSQRISTIKNADQIIVLDKGEIVGKGTHKHLMETCQTYKEIALSQLSLEELK